MTGMQTNIAGVKRLFELTNVPQEKILRETSITLNRIKYPLLIQRNGRSSMLERGLFSN